MSETAFRLRLALGIALLMAAPYAALAQAPETAQAQAPPAQAVTIEARFQEWLRAFNSGDAAAIKAFHAKHLDERNPVFILESAQDTCGLTIVRVEESSPTAMTVLLRERCLPGMQRAKIELAPDRSKLKALDLTPLALPGDGPINVAADIAARLAARDEFAGSLIVVRDGKAVLAKSWGLADPATRRPMTLDTPMLLASAGKMFTAVAVLQLVETGKINLDAPLSTYLADYPNKDMARVTIRQLLTHRGGTGDIGILGRKDGANRAKIRTIADIIRLNGDRPPDFPPGSKDDYSNYGFVLLGAVVEKVSGRSYHDYVTQHIFKPAGMRNSGFPTTDQLGRVAVGYTRFFGEEPKLVPNIDVLPWQGTPAGGGVASANDMRRFFDAMISGKLLSPETLRLATAPGATSWYGLGFIVEAGEHPHWGHGGMSYGSDVALHTYPKDRTTFICMAARDSVCNRLMFAWALRAYPYK